MLKHTGARTTRITLVIASLLSIFVFSCTFAQEAADNPLSIGLVVHLEGWPLDQGENVLDRYEDIVLDYADLFEEYGALLTLETINAVDAILQYDGRHNFLSELESRGHAVGVHADLGGRPGLSYINFRNTLNQMRLNHLQLGLDVRHASGICSYLDWVTAAIEAGYEATSSGVAYCYSSMAEQDRPAEYRNCANPAACHQFIPQALSERLYPWRAFDGSNWLDHNPDGELILIPSSGTLNCFEENRATTDSNTGCTFTQADIDGYIGELETALSIINRGDVNTYYVVWSLGGQLDKVLLERWLQAIEPFVESGEVAWRTLHQMIDLYVTSE